MSNGSGGGKMSDVPEPEMEMAESSTHTYRAHLKQDGNKSHIISGEFPGPLSYAEYRKRKFKIGSNADMIKEDFEEILRYFEKRSCRDIHVNEVCESTAHDANNDDISAEIRTKYHVTEVEREYLIRHWLFHMGVEDHVVNALLLKDSDSSGGSLTHCVQNLHTLNATGDIGLKRNEHIHRLYNTGSMGSQVGIHYIPQTKQGSIFWSENFNFRYSTVFVEPLRPVATWALSRLLSDRLHLLPISSEASECSSSACVYRVDQKREALQHLIDHVCITPPLPPTSSQRVIEDNSPHYTGENEYAMLSEGNPSSVSIDENVSCHHDSEANEEKNENLLSSAKGQALENCIGRHFEGVADCALEMLFKFSESYIDILFDEDRDVVSENQEVDDNLDLNADDEPGSLNFSCYPEDKIFRGYDPIRKKRSVCIVNADLSSTATSNDDDANRRKKRKTNNIKNRGEASFNWEHVVECTQSAASESATLMNSNFVDIHPLLPQLQVTPALLQRVKNRATSLFCLNSKKCVPVAMNDIAIEQVPKFPSSK